MKIKEGYILREIAGSFVVVPVGDNVVDLSSMITINETGAFLWGFLEKGADEDSLCAALMSEYEGAPEDEMRNDIREFISVLKEKDILE